MATVLLLPYWDLVQGQALLFIATSLISFSRFFHDPDDFEKPRPVVSVDSLHFKRFPGDETPSVIGVS